MQIHIYFKKIYILKFLLIIKTQELWHRFYYIQRLIRIKNIRTIISMNLVRDL